MKGTAKKIANWVCVIASVCVIGSTVSGFIADKNVDEKPTTEQTQVME